MYKHIHNIQLNLVITKLKPKLRRYIYYFIIPTIAIYCSTYMPNGMHNFKHARTMAPRIATQQHMQCIFNKITIESGKCNTRLFSVLTLQCDYLSLTLFPWLIHIVMKPAEVYGRQSLTQWSDVFSWPRGSAVWAHRLSLAGSCWFHAM